MPERVEHARINWEIGAALEPLVPARGHFRSTIRLAPRVISSFFLYGLTTTFAVMKRG